MGFLASISDFSTLLYSYFKHANITYLSILFAVTNILYQLGIEFCDLSTISLELLYFKHTFNSNIYPFMKI